VMLPIGCYHGLPFGGLTFYLIDLLLPWYLRCSRSLCWKGAGLSSKGLQEVICFCGPSANCFRWAVSTVFVGGSFQLVGAFEAAAFELRYDAAASLLEGQNDQSSGALTRYAESSVATETNEDPGNPRRRKCLESISEPFLIRQQTNTILGWTRPCSE